MRFNRVRIGIPQSVAGGAVAASYFVGDGPRQTGAGYDVRHEYRLPIRDSVKLFRQVYVQNDGSKTDPFLFQCTPCGVQPYGEDGIVRNWAPPNSTASITFSFQDVRGRFQSEGEENALRGDQSDRLFCLMEATPAP